MSAYSILKNKYLHMQKRFWQLHSMSYKAEKKQKAAISYAVSQLTLIKLSESNDPEVLKKLAARTITAMEFILNEK